VKKAVALILSLALLVCLSGCSSEKGTVSEPEEYVITLYAVENLAENRIKTKEITVTGKYSEQKLILELSRMMGISFDVEIACFLYPPLKEGEPARIEYTSVGFSKESSLFAEALPEKQNENFTFSDLNARRWAILDSIWMTLKENMGKPGGISEYKNTYLDDQVSVRFAALGSPEKPLYLEGLTPVDTIPMDTAYQGSTSFLK